MRLLCGHLEQCGVRSEGLSTNFGSIKRSKRNLAAVCQSRWSSPGLVKFIKKVNCESDIASQREKIERR